MGGHMLRNRWPDVVGMGGHMFRNTHTPHRFINFIRKRLVAWAFLRLCIRISSTSTARQWFVHKPWEGPLASTARQSQCFRPRIEITTSSRCHLSAGTGRSRRILAAICVPNRWHHTQMLSYETITPRSANKSSTSRRLRENSWYAQTA